MNDSTCSGAEEMAMDEESSSGEDRSSPDEDWE